MSGDMVPARMVRDRVFDSVTDKSVLAAFALFADDDGTSMYPALQTVADDTGASVRTVQRILNKYRQKGLLKMTAEARQHKPRTYKIDLDVLATFPLSETGRRRLERQQKRPHSKSPGVTPVTPLATDREPSRGDISASRGDISASRGDKAWHPTCDTRPGNREGTSPLLSPPSGEIALRAGSGQAVEAGAGKIDGDIWFAEFWERFPRQRRGNRQKAWRASIQARERASSVEIMNGVLRYAASDEVERGYAKGCAAWLNDDRWAHDFTTPRPGAGGKVSPGSIGIKLYQEAKALEEEEERSHGD